MSEIHPDAPTFTKIENLDIINGTLWIFADSNIYYNDGVVWNELTSYNSWIPEGKFVPLSQKDNRVLITYTNAFAIITLNDKLVLSSTDITTPTMISNPISGTLSLTNQIHSLELSTLEGINIGNYREGDYLPSTGVYIAILKNKNGDFISTQKLIIE